MMLVGERPAAAVSAGRRSPYGGRRTVALMSTRRPGNGVSAPIGARRWPARHTKPSSHTQRGRLMTPRRAAVAKSLRGDSRARVDTRLAVAAIRAGRAPLRRARYRQAGYGRGYGLFQEKRRNTNDFNIFGGDGVRQRLPFLTRLGCRRKSIHVCIHASGSEGRPCRPEHSVLDGRRQHASTTHLTPA
jgi:hypothetical protein